MPVSVRSDMLGQLVSRDDLPGRAPYARKPGFLCLAWASSPARWRAKVPGGRVPVLRSAWPYRDSRIGEVHGNAVRGTTTMKSQVNDNPRSAMRLRERLMRRRQSGRRGVKERMFPQTWWCMLTLLLPAWVHLPWVERLNRVTAAIRPNRGKVWNLMAS